MSSETAWNVAGPPRNWPSPPEWWSFSSLHEAIDCPRRWALKRGNYPWVWAHCGYPSYPSWPALRGSVIHRAVETILRTATGGSCTSVVEAVRHLGGFSAVLRETFEELIASNKSNPRFGQQEGSLLIRFGEDAPAMRRDLQKIVSGLPGIGDRGQVSRPGTAPRQLGPGLYAEVDIESLQLHWRGRADLVRVGEDGVEIIDFKTGTPQDKHSSQLQIYAMMWTDDLRLNPEGKAPLKLTLRYPSDNKNVPLPDATEREQLRSEIVGLSDGARRALDHSPPPAIPEVEKCTYCEVRQVCQSYWESDLPFADSGLAAEGSTGRTYGDFQVLLDAWHGPKSWSARLLSRGGDYVEPVRIRFGGNPPQLTKESVLRILRARIESLSADQEDEEKRSKTDESLREILIGASTEWFLL